MSEAREKLSQAVEADRSEAVFLEHSRRPAAVLVSAERYTVFQGAIALSNRAMADDPPEERVQYIGMTDPQEFQAILSEGRWRRVEGILASLAPEA